MLVWQRRIIAVLSLTVLGAIGSPLARGDIQFTGDVTPADPTVWNWENVGIVGAVYDGGIIISNGSQLSSNYVTLGLNVGVTGSVTVDGIGSNWTSNGFYNIVNGGIFTDVGQVLIGSGGEGRLTISNGGTVNFTFVSTGINESANSTSEVTVDGIGSQWLTDRNLSVGDLAGTGKLTITNGGMVNNNSATVGSAAGSLGIVAVDGIGSQWVTNSLVVGSSGVGLLNITNKANVNGSTVSIGGAAGGNGTVVVDGAGANMTIKNPSGSPFPLGLIQAGTLVIGNNGNGTLNIIHGGTVNSDYGVVGCATGSVGDVTVDGNGSSWNLSKVLSVGGQSQGAFIISIDNGKYAGTGTMQIIHGGLVASSDGYLGNSSGATGNVTVKNPGSQWTIQNSLNIGGGTSIFGLLMNPSLPVASGVLTIQDGGTVSTSNAYVGYWINSQGTAIVDGANTLLSITHNLYVGGSGTFNMALGSQQPSGTGNLNILNGATVGTSASTLVGTNGTIAFGPGGGTINTGDLFAAPSQLTGAGIINTSGMVSDLNLHFDSTHGLKQTFSLNQSTINLNFDGSHTLGVGYIGTGNLTIADGFQINSSTGYLGYTAGATGNATVTDAHTKWEISGNLTVGNNGTGNLVIAHGGLVKSNSANIGYIRFSNGTVTVDGPGSAWTVQNDLYVSGGSGSNGYNLGTGSLNIFNGGAVSSATTYLGNLGSINFGSNGGTLNTGTLYASPAQLTGSGIINTTGLVSDLNLVIDTTHPLPHIFNFNQVTVNFNPSSSSVIGVGYLGSGNMAIVGGGKLISGSGYLGYQWSSEGMATVSEPGSSWQCNGDLTVGYKGMGTMNITKGGVVSCASVTMGYSSFGYGKVDGKGSKWMVNGDMYVGKNGIGSLSITNGGMVSVNNLYAGSPGHGMVSITNGGVITAKQIQINGYLAIDVGLGSKLTVDNGAGTIINNNRIQVVASSGAAPGVYNPINATSWTGSGRIQAVGGTWDNLANTMTVNPARSVTAGSWTNLDLSLTQRLTITDPKSGTTLGAAFQGSPSPTLLNFVASVSNDSERHNLQNLIGLGKSVLSSWDVDANSGFAQGDPIYLSLDIGAGYSLEQLKIWHFDGSNWSLFQPDGLAYGGTYANFLGTELGGYAVTGVAVPEPTSLSLLSLGVFTLLRRNPKKTGTVSSNLDVWHA